MKRVFFIVFIGFFVLSSNARAAVTLTSPATLGGDENYVFFATSDGSILVGSSQIAGNTENHVFRLVNGVMTDLGTLGGEYSYPTFVTPDGAVIIGSSSLVGNNDEHVFRWENGVMVDIGTLGGDYSNAIGATPDGNIIIGNTNLANSQQRAFHWQNGVMTDLGTLGGNYSFARSFSADGSVVAGSSREVGGDQHAFRWENGVMTDLGTLGGDYSSANFISADGNVVVGESYLPGNANEGAFRWENGVMTNLGTLGGSDTSASAMTANGNVITGVSYTAGDIEDHAFRWENGVMTDLGTLGGTSSSPGYISTDGSVIVGESTLAGDIEERVFRWENGVMTDLGTLGGNDSNLGMMSADGSVIFGSSRDANGDNYTFLWHEDTGTMRSLEEILTSAGVNITGWRFEGYKDMTMSADGTLVYGAAEFNGSNRAFLMTATGLTTPVDFQESLVSAPVPAQQGSQAVVSGIGQSLLVARNALSMYIPRPAARQENPRFASADPKVLSDVEPAAGGERTRRERFGHAFYALGDLGIGHDDNFSNYCASGATGLLIGISDDLAVGAGIVGSHSRVETSLGGNSTVEAWGFSAMMSYEPASGFRIYGTASAVPLDIKTKRNYVNGGGIDASRGETEGMGYGVAARAGWSVPIDDKKAVMPYTEVQWSKTKIDAYTEQGGGIPASYADQDSDSWTSRLGLEYSQALTSDMTFRVRGAWGHRYGDANGVVTTAMGITQTISGSAGERDWAEGGVGAIWHVSDKTSLSLDLSGRAGRTGEPALGLVVGLTIGF